MLDSGLRPCPVLSRNIATVSPSPSPDPRPGLPKAASGPDRPMQGPHPSTVGQATKP